MSYRERFVMYGRCKSGKRWFWYAAALSEGDGPCGDPVCDGYSCPHEYGWTDTEAEALEVLYAAVARFNGDLNWCPDPRRKDSAQAGVAAKALKRINKNRRDARPPSGETESAATEFLWTPPYRRWDDYENEWHYYEPGRYSIVKKTTKRIYYIRYEDRGYGTGPEVGYIDRVALERDGMVKVSAATGDWRSNLTELYLTEEKAREAASEWWKYDRANGKSPGETPDLRQLKQAMADAHPDRGGTREAFTAARLAYKRALRTAANT